MRNLYIINLLVFFILVYTSSTAQNIDSYDLLKENTFPQGMEGPAVDKWGRIFAVNFEKKGTVGVVNGMDKAKLFINLPEGSVGNGIRFGKDGLMYVADYTNHNILVIDSRDMTIRVFAHSSQMNQPNDLTISRKTGIIYASDPNWKDSTGNIWMIKPNGEIKILEQRVGTTNGIEVTRNGRKLYVNESIQRKIWVYSINTDGTLSGKKLFYSFSDFGMDGMRCDSMGNLYVTRHGKGTVVKLSPKGKLLKEYYLKGKLPTNLTLSNEEDMIYVTVADRGCFEVIPL